MRIRKSRRWTGVLSGALFAALASAGCATTDVDIPPEARIGTARATAEVGPRGGHLSLLSLELDVPPNAVAENTSITVEVTSTRPPGFAIEGDVYTFQPAGLIFASPIDVSFPAPAAPAATPAAPPPIVYWSLLESVERFEPLASTSAEGRVVAHPRHLGTGFVGAPAGVSPSPCVGPGEESCGRCGSRSRRCASGVFSDWSACSDEGVCAPASTETCDGGTRTCNARCEWLPCHPTPPATCEGATTQPCGNCGAQTRACEGGTWSSWSACSGEGVCAVDAARTCDVDGTQTCTASCAWAACVPAPIQRGRVAVGANEAHACAIRTDGTLACWGENTYGESSPPAGTFREVTAGDRFSCGLKTDGTVTCWGRNDNGETSSPAGTFRTISSHLLTTCGIRPDDTVECWGLNLPPTPATGTFRQISVGWLEACGLQLDGLATCWAYDWGPIPGGAFDQISVGEEYTCAIRPDATLTCWGRGVYGPDRYTRGQLDAPPGTFLQVSAAAVYGCALRTDHTVSCWGGRDAGNPGATAAAAATPPAGTFREIDAGDIAACGIRTDGTLACWGAIAAPPSGTF